MHAVKIISKSQVSEHSIKSLKEVFKIFIIDCIQDIISSLTFTLGFHVLIGFCLLDKIMSIEPSEY